MAGRGVNEMEREGAIEFIPAGGEAGGIGMEPNDASEQWSEFETLRDQGEGAARGMFVWVYRIPTDAAGNPVSSVESEQLFVAPIDVYTLPQIFERVKKEYMSRGFGRSLIRIQVRREKVRGVLWQKVFAIIKGLNDDGPDATKGTDASGDGNSIHALAQMFDRTLQAQQEQNRRLIEQMFSRQNSAPVDPMQQTERMLAMVASLTTAINGRPVAAAAAPAQTLGEMASGFREMLKLSQEFGGGGGGFDEPEGALGTLKSLTPWAGVFEKLIDNMKSPAVPVPQMRRAPRLPASAMPHPDGGNGPTAPSAPGIAVQNAARSQGIPTPNQPTGSDPMLLKIVEMTNDLITLKSQGGDPAQIGKTVAGMLTADVEDRLLDLLEADDWFAKLSGFNPRVTEHREFFQIVRDSLLAEYEFSDEIPATGDGAPLPS